MVQKSKWILLVGILLCLGAFSTEQDRGVSLDPFNDDIRIEFIQKNEVIADMFDIETTEDMFEIEGPGDYAAVMPAIRRIEHIDKCKMSKTIFSTKFTVMGVEYVARYEKLSSYETLQERPNGKQRYRRIDKTIFEEQPINTNPILLNGDECQRAFENGALEDYLTDKGFTMASLVQANDKDLFLLGLKLARHGVDDVEQVRQKKEQETQNAKVFAKLEDFCANSSGGSMSLLRIHFENNVVNHVPIDKPMALERYNDTNKQKEFFYLWPLSIETINYVFFREATKSYRLKGFRTTFTETDSPMIFHEMRIPIYKIGDGSGSPWEMRETPQDALCTVYQCTKYEVSSQDGMLCVASEDNGKYKGKHFLRLCTQTTITIVGTFTTPDGIEVPIDKTTTRYSLSGQVEVCKDCGKWEVKDFSNGKLMTHEGELNEFYRKAVKLTNPIAGHK